MLNGRNRMEPKKGMHIRSEEIKAACEYYADHPDQRWRPLQVDQCSGRTYNECFVKLGTGEANGVGKNWIFFDQIRFRSRIDFDAVPLVLPLLSNVDKVSRRLAIPTAEWLDIDRLDFREQLKTALRSCKAAYSEGRHERPWIFFFGQEAHYDDVDFRAELQSGVAILIREMRWTWGRRRSSMHIPSKRQMRQGGYLARATDHPATIDGGSGTAQ